MTQGPNPPISGTAIVGALGGDQASADSHTVSATQSALDEAELREIERAEYYADKPALPLPAPQSRRRSFLDRLFRR